jgi:protocatechuate 3,4-dioxygenase, alpha subunit
MATRRNIKESASQTAGPYVHIGLTPNWLGIQQYGGVDLGRSMVGEAARGERVTVTGLIYDGAGELVRDAMLEFWQADAEGLYRSPHEQRGEADPAFAGWGRVPCDFETGLYRIDTVKPGTQPDPDGTLQAPHIGIWIVARGIMVGLSTRMYFGDEAEANAADPLLTRLEPDRATTLIAPRSEQDGAVTYTFDIRLQGDGETVFLDY